MKVLFLAPWPQEAASTRLRLVQYFPYLRAQGVEPVLRPFMSERFYRFVYQPGNLGRKMLHFSLSLARRLQDVLQAAHADLVVIHREAFPFGTILLERLIARAGVPTLFDFDDAIYLSDGASDNGLVSRLKRPGKTAELLKLSSAVIAGNSHLAAYSTGFNRNVAVIPTPVDSQRFRPREQATEGGRVVIGWIGSGTTARYLRQVAEPLRRLVENYPQVEIHFVGGRDSLLKGFPARQISWSLGDEPEVVRRFDIGLMPYPDDEWARGKCAHKALLYMSVGIPAVCSPVGMANELIRDGETGMLASDPDDWYARLAALVESPELRQHLGRQGRALVEEQFDVRVLAPRLLAVLHAAREGRMVGTEIPAYGHAASD